MQPHIRLCAMAMACLWIASAAGAGEDTWKQAGTGWFDLGTYWTDGSAPTASDTVTFNLDATCLAKFYVDATTQNLSILDGDVTFAGDPSIHDLTYHVTAGGADVTVNHASLTLGAAGLSTVDLEIGDRLTVTNGGSLNITHGCTVTAVDFDVALDAGGPPSSVTVDGSGSSLTVTDTAGIRYIGRSGAAGELTFSNGAQGNFAGILSLAESASSNTRGTLNIRSGSLLHVDALNAGTSGVAGQSAAINIDDNASTLYVDGAGATTLGAAAASTTTVNINSGYLVTGSGLFTVNPTATINIGHDTVGGSLSVSGDALIDGGSIHIASNGRFYWYGHAMTVTHGGQLTGGQTLNIGSSSQGTLDINNAAQVELDDLTIGRNSTGDGAVTLDGDNSRLTVHSKIEMGGYSNSVDGGTAALTIRNGASVQTNELTIGGGKNSSATVTVTGENSLLETGPVNIAGHDLGITSAQGRLDILDGAAMHSSWANLTHGSSTSAVVNVTGADSRWDIDGTLSFGAGYTADRVELNIGDGGLVSVGNSVSRYYQGTININAGGALLATEAQQPHLYTVNAGGLLAANIFTSLGTTYDWTVNGSLGLGVDLAAIPGAHTLASGQTLTVNEDLIVAYNHPATLSVTGGQLYADDTLTLRTGGTLDIHTGTAQIDTLVFSGGQVTQNPGSLIRVNRILNLGSDRTFTGSLYLGHTRGSGAGQLSLNSTNHLTVDTDLQIGNYNCDATLSITGGRLDVGRDLFVGRSSYGGQETSTGSLTVSGGSVAVAGLTAIGQSGTGSLTLTNNAQLTSAGNARIGHWRESLSVTDGYGFVTVDHAAWQVTDNLLLGGDHAVYRGGHGQLIIQNSGSVSCADLVIAGGYDGYGYVEVTGAGSRLQTAALNLAEAEDTSTATDAYAVFEIFSGATVHSASANLTHGNSTTATVRVNGSGSRWDIDGTLSFGGGYAGNANLYIADGGVVSVGGRISRDYQGEIHVNAGGILLGNEAYAASRYHVNTGGLLAANTFTHLDDDWTVNGSLGIGVDLGAKHGTFDLTSAQTLAIGENLIVGYGASGTLMVEGQLTVGQTLQLNSGGTIFLNSNGQITADTLDLSAGGFNEAYDATLTVNHILGIGSDQWLSGHLQLGHDAGGSLTLSNGQSLSVGRTATIGGQAPAALTIGRNGSFAADTLDIANGGSVALSGGQLQLVNLMLTGGSFAFNAGTLRIDNDLILNPGEQLGDSLVLDARRTLVVQGATTIEWAGSLILNGGSLVTGSLANYGSFTFNTGRLELTGESLYIGNAGSFGNTISVENQQTYAGQMAMIDSTGLLIIHGGGTVEAESAYNMGEIQLDADTARLNANMLTNDGVIRGSGRIAGSLNNGYDGEVRLASGDRMIFAQQANNTGRIEVFGGEIEFAQGLYNNDETGSIIARDAILRFGVNPYSGLGLENAGGIAITGNTTDITGDLLNTASGRIAISGGADVTFWDDMTNDGDIRVSSDCTAVFFGCVDGSGSFSGTGTVYFEGDICPGHSPAAIQFGGNVVFGDLAALEMELAGLIGGSQYDQLLIDGSVALAGGLQLLLLDDFSPELSQSFTLIEAESIIGCFDQLLLPQLGGGLSWQTMQTAQSFTVTIVPEPHSIGLFAAIGGIVLLLRRRSAWAR